MSSNKTSASNVPKITTNITTKRMRVIKRQRVRTFDSPSVYIVDFLTVSKYEEIRPLGNVYNTPPLIYGMFNIHRIITPKNPMFRQMVVDYKIPLVHTNTGGNTN
jgi:hypothetical protein